MVSQTHFLEQRRQFSASSTLTVVLAAQFLCWTLAPSLVNDAPPLDVVENSLWGAEHIIASYKNPVLASMLLEGMRLLTGAYGWPAYVLSQIAVCSTLLFVFLLGRRELGDARALAGTLALTACYYFTWHTPEFNQDIIELPMWAGVALSLWRATQTGKTLWWIALGLFAAGAVYGKLSAGVLLTSAALWLLFDSRARQTLRTKGPWLSLATFGVLLAPLLRWLADGGLQKITAYAIERGHGSSFSIPFWLFVQAALVLPMVIVLLASGCVAWPPRPAKIHDEPAAVPGNNIRRFVTYLWFMTIAPLALTTVATLFAKTGAKFMWGTPMLNLTGLLAVSCLAGEFAEKSVKRLFAISLALIVCGSAAYALNGRFAPQLTGSIGRTNWPQAEISRRMREVWQTETGRPLTIVAGESSNWTSGLVALSPDGIASVFTSGNLALTPWVTNERIEREGVLVVWRDQPWGPPVYLKHLIANHPIRRETFALRHPGKAKDVTIDYVILPPKQSGLEAPAEHVK